MPHDDGHERFDIAKAVVLSGWSLVLLTCISVVGTALYLFLTGNAIEKPLTEWAAMCFVFLFVSTPQMVKEFISK